MGMRKYHTFSILFIGLNLWYTNSYAEVNLALNRMYAEKTFGYFYPERALDGDTATQTSNGYSNNSYHQTGGISVDLGARYTITRSVVVFNDTVSAYSIWRSPTREYWKECVKFQPTIAKKADVRTVALTSRYFWFAIGPNLRTFTMNINGTDTLVTRWQFPSIKEIELYGTLADSASDSILEYSSYNFYDSAFTDWNVEWGHHNWWHMTDGANEAWISGVTQSPGHFVYFDMGTPKNLNQIVLDCSFKPQDKSVPFDIYTTNDTALWGEPVASGKGGVLDTVNFPTQQARYVKLVLTGTSGSWWQISEVSFNYATTRPVSVKRSGAAIKKTQASTAAVLWYDCKGRMLPQQHKHSGVTSASVPLGRGVYIRHQQGLSHKGLQGGN